MERKLAPPYIYLCRKIFPVLNINVILLYNLNLSWYNITLISTDKAEDGYKIDEI